MVDTVPPTINAEGNKPSRRGFVGGLLALLAGGTATALFVDDAEARRKQPPAPGQVVAVDAKTLEPIYTNQPNMQQALTARRYIASLTKEMALLCVADWIHEQAGRPHTGHTYDLDPQLAGCGHSEEIRRVLAREVPLTARARGVASVSFTRDLLRRGNNVTALSLEEALRIMMLVSANDVVEAVNDMMGGTLVARMNAKARALGMTGTHFTDCTGLPPGGRAVHNYTCARDWFEMKKHFKDTRPQFLPYMGQLRYAPRRAGLNQWLRRKEPGVGMVDSTYLQPLAQYVDPVRGYQGGTPENDVRFVSLPVPSAEAASLMGVQTTTPDTGVDQGSDDEAATPPEDLTSDDPDEDVDRNGIDGYLRVKTGYTGAAGRTASGECAAIFNGVEESAFVFITGCGNGAYRRQWLERARDACFDHFNSRPRPPRPAPAAVVTPAIPAPPAG